MPILQFHHTVKYSYTSRSVLEKYTNKISFFKITRSNPKQKQTNNNKSSLLQREPIPNKKNKKQKKKQRENRKTERRANVIMKCIPLIFLC